MSIYDLNLFLRLSADLSYQLSAKTVEWQNVLNIILDQKKMTGNDFDLLLEVCRYLDMVYAKKRRRLGSSAVLHPFRVAAFSARSFEKSTLLDLLTALLHDRFEDIRPKGSRPDDHEKADDVLREIISNLSHQEQWYLMERLHWLTKKSEENYYQYIGRLLMQAVQTPEAIWIKLADRLDNTLDMRIVLKDPFEEIDFFETIFQILFLPENRGIKIELASQTPTSFSGSQQLYQLFKNITLLSLIRQGKSTEGDRNKEELFKALIRASIKEAQRIILYLTSHFRNDIPLLRKLLLETMTYIQNGGIEAVTPPNKKHRLDGLLISMFDDSNKRSRAKKLALLYADKELLIESALSFVVIFYSFLNNPAYYVRGISMTGIHPEKYG